MSAVVSTSSSTLPSSLRANPRLSQWVRFLPDGTVEVRSGKVEIGQGILTALAQVAADELDIPLSKIRMVRARTDESPNEAVTAGSMSVADSGAAIRLVCAEIRAILADAIAREGAHATYASLAAQGCFDRDATGAAAPRSWTERGMVGSDAPRLDLPDKVFGRARFIHDLVVPEMLHGRVLRPPSRGAQLASLDEARARGVPGISAIVRDGRFVGVVARTEAAAVKALARLREDAKWSESETLPDEGTLAEWLASRPHETTPIVDRGASDAASASVMRATYTRPYLAHASIAPSCAIARWDGDDLHVWSHTQGIFNQRADLALAFAMPPERIVVEHVEGAGCYGHNAQDDAAFDAAMLARAMPGKPVKVLWSREDELSWAPFGPAMRVDIEAALDTQGEIVDWRCDVWSNGHSSRPGRAKSTVLLGAGHRENAAVPPIAINTPLESGGGAQRNAVPPYALPALHIRNHRLLEMPLRTSALRALGAFVNVFAVEGFVDEVAASRGEDPLAWRLRHLADARGRAVLEAAARAAEWSRRRKREGEGYGIGYARYKQNAAYCAVVAHVEAEREIRVRRLWIAVDVGLAVNPDGVRNQIEGGAIQATSWTLKEAVRFDRTRVTSGSWEAYPILRFSEVPAVEVELLQQPQEPSVGAGEAPIGPTAAAIGNAVFDALGVRVRDLPITSERIASA